MISIIIPVYQAEKYIRRTVDSVLSQTYENWELVLVDDGSTDCSGLICDEYAMKDHRIKVFHKTNGGQSSARNMGLCMARGEYVCFVDNDDIIVPEACEVLVRNMLKYQADISACSYKILNEQGKIESRGDSGIIALLDNKEGMRRFLSREIDIYVWTKLYRKSFLRDNGILFEEGRSDEDFLFNSKAFLCADKTVQSDYPVYIYSVRENSTCRQFPKLQLKKYISDTLYRLNKIENIIAQHYPDFIRLAKRQSILYRFIMLGTISRNKEKYSDLNYKEIHAYLHANRNQVISERRYWGMSYIGVVLASYMPSLLYFYYRKWKDRMK